LLLKAASEEGLDVRLDELRHQQFFGRQRRRYRRKHHVAFVELEIKTDVGQPVYVDTVSLVKRP